MLRDEKDAVDALSRRLHFYGLAKAVEKGLSQRDIAEMKVERFQEATLFRRIIYAIKGRL